MSINAVVWTTGDLVTQTKMQGMSDDATNDTDNIHPQYLPLYFDETLRHTLDDRGATTNQMYIRRNRVNLAQTGIQEQIVDLDDDNSNPMVWYICRVVFLIMEGMTGNSIELKVKPRVASVAADGAVSIQVVDENAVMVSNQEILMDQFTTGFADAGFSNVSLAGVTAGTYLSVDLGFNLNFSSSNILDVQSIRFGII